MDVSFLKFIESKPVFHLWALKNVTDLRNLQDRLLRLANLSMGYFLRLYLLRSKLKVFCYTLSKRFILLSKKSKIVYVVEVNEKIKQC